MSVAHNDTMQLHDVKQKAFAAEAPAVYLCLGQKLSRCHVWRCTCARHRIKNQLNKWASDQNWTCLWSRTFSSYLSICLRPEQGWWWLALRDSAPHAHETCFRVRQPVLNPTILHSFNRTATCAVRFSKLDRCLWRIWWKRLHNSEPSVVLVCTAFATEARKRFGQDSPEVLNEASIMD